MPTEKLRIRYDHLRQITFIMSNKIIYNATKKKMYALDQLKAVFFYVKPLIKRVNEKKKKRFGRLGGLQQQPCEHDRPIISHSHSTRETKRVLIIRVAVVFSVLHNNSRGRHYIYIYPFHLYFFFLFFKC